MKAAGALGMHPSLSKLSPQHFHYELANLVGVVRSACFDLQIRHPCCCKGLSHKLVPPCPTFGAMRPVVRFNRAKYFHGRAVTQDKIYVLRLNSVEGPRTAGLGQTRIDSDNIGQTNLRINAGLDGLNVIQYS